MNQEIHGGADQDDLGLLAVDLLGIAEQLDDDDTVRDEDSQEADDAQLLNDDRQDEVRVRGRKICVFADAVAEAQAEPAAGGEGHQAVDQLVAGIVLVRKRIDGGQNAVLLIFLQRQCIDQADAPRRQQNDRECQQRQKQKPQPSLRPAQLRMRRDQETGEGDQSHDDRGPQVRLQNADDQNVEGDDSERPPREIAGGGELLLDVAEIAGDDHDDHDLRKLGRLNGHVDARERNTDPGAGAADR